MSKEGEDSNEEVAGDVLAEEAGDKGDPLAEEDDFPWFENLGFKVWPKIFLSLLV